MRFADRCGLAGSPDDHAGPAKSLEAEGNAAASSGGKRSRGKAELTMTTREVRIDRSRPLTVQTETGHNRWHPDIPPVLECDPGHEVILETRDALDGQLTPESTVAQVGQVDLGVVHPLTGPACVTGAEPGDLAGGGDPGGRTRAVRLHLPDPWLRVPRRRLHRAAPRPVADRRRLRDFAGPPRSPRARCAVHGHDRPDPRSRGLAPHTRPGA